MSRDRLRSTGSLLAGVYVVAVAVLETLRHTTTWPRVTDLASTPAGVAAGHVWPLLTSGLVVAGAPLAQLVGLGVTVLVVIQLLGAGAFWMAAGAAHLGSAVLAYAGIGILWLIQRSDVAGAIGALVAAGLGSGRVRERALAVAAIGLFYVVFGASGGLAGVEHVLAFALGAAVTWALGRRAATPSLASA
jgi:hypothetical protein